MPCGLHTCTLRSNSAEILALENVPLAQQPRPALFLRQIFQHAHIVRVVSIRAWLSYTLAAINT